ncbi:hypothetical protein ABZZ20_34190 [Streptomyces sp. NPDC006430]|uniref:hypothetical protein n=1 Tax=Streptomyces sp. NPDC006430 TaxID=3154299 RepID=UPI0033ACADE1
MAPLIRGLIFTCFLDPERVSMPDVDIDIDIDIRHRLRRVSALRGDAVWVHWRMRQVP